MTVWPKSLTLIGAGKMGAAMLAGWLARGLPARGVAVIEPMPSPELLTLAQAHRFALNPPATERLAPEILTLAIKPQMLESAAPAISALAGPQSLVLSILAGKTIADLRNRLPNAGAIVRAMPNTPAAVMRGASGAAAEPQATPGQRDLVAALLGALGVFHWLDDEHQIDVVTAVSGSGPAYVFALVEALAAAGEKLGLAPAVAMSLARATVEGAGELMYRDPATPAARLRENVTSPGGTTAAALAVLQARDGLDALMTRAVAAAHRRAGELAG